MTVSALQKEYLDAMGIQSWVLRGAEPEPAPLDWPQLEQQVKDCMACDLYQSRTQTVFGVGSQQADWMIVGEAPGVEEDRLGEPFVGHAGQLLNAMLRAIGLQREEVYITNILKCQPPNNRDPHADEAASCEGYLRAQINLLQPKIILAVGRIAAQQLLESKDRLATLRGRVHYYSDTAIPVVVTYHPAYLLRKPTEKRKAWHDLQLACQTLAAS